MPLKDEVKRLFSFKPEGLREDPLIPGKPGNLGEGNAPNIQTTKDVDTGSSNVARQILNPGGEKYDEVRYGITGQADGPLSKATTGPQLHSTTASDATLRTNPGVDKADGGLPRQTINPGGGQYDEVRYAEQAQSDAPLGTAIAGTGFIGQQESLPGQGWQRLSSNTEPGSLSDPSATNTSLSQLHEQRGGSVMSIKSGIQGPFATETDDVVSSGDRQILPHRTVDSSSVDPAQRCGVDEAVRQPLTQGTQAHPVREAALTDAGAAVPLAGAGLVAAESQHPTHEQTSSTASRKPDTNVGDVGIPSDSFGFHKPGEKPAEGYVHVHGPHATDMVDLFDPHVPGEFPDEDGEDRHKKRHTAEAAAVGGAAGLGAADHEEDRDRSYPSRISEAVSVSQPSHATSPATSLPIAESMTRQDRLKSESQTQSHLGRDAAIAGGLGAAGIGAYELEKDRRDESALPSQAAPANFTSQTTSTDAGVVTTDTARSPMTHSHIGRDDAIAGGVGAAGVGAYELEKGSRAAEPALASDPAPASKSSYPTSSAAATAPYEPTQSQNADPHLGRDAAIAGGFGAAGVSAYDLERARRADEPALAREPLPTNQTSHSTSAAATEPVVAGQPQQAAPHLGRDAAIAGGVGAAGVGAYELERDRHADEPSRMSDKVPTTHASGPSSEVDAALIAPVRPHENEPHIGRDATIAGGVGAAGLGAYEVEENRRAAESTGVQNVAPAAQPSTAHSTTVDAPFAATQPQRAEPHLGRDAAITGGAGAVVLGAYEVEKSSRAAPINQSVRHQPGTLGEQTTTSTYASAPSTTAARHEPLVAPGEVSRTEPHYGRDAVVAGGAAAGGVGAYELAKHREDRSTGPTAAEPYQDTTASATHSRTHDEPEKYKEQKTTEPHHHHHHHRDPKAEPRRDVDPAQTAAVEAAHRSHKRQGHDNLPNSYDDEHARDELLDGSLPKHHIGTKNGHSVLHKSTNQELKHERDLEKAREREAALGGDRGTHKEGLFERIKDRLSGEHSRK